MFILLKDCEKSNQRVQTELNIINIMYNGTMANGWTLFSVTCPLNEIKKQ